jgi:hypothetical protein
MVNQQQTNTSEQLDKFAESLEAARKMQQEWLTYGLDFVHLYVEDVDGDWLENWGSDDIIGNSRLDAIKEFLVSDDMVAVRVRQYLGERSLFDFAVNLEESWRITEVNLKLYAVKNLLVSDENSQNLTCKIDELADSLLAKLAEIL